jgi:hypothetical protein
MINATPSINEQCNMIKVVIDVEIVTFERKNITITTIIDPGITSALGPNLSYSLPDVCEMIPFKIPPGKKARPVAKAVKRSPRCKNNGKIIKEENRVIINTTVKMVARVNIGKRKARTSRIGSSSCNWRLTKTIKEKIPIAINR